MIPFENNAQNVTPETGSPTKTESIDTPDTIIRGYDKADIVETNLKTEQAQFQSWLDFRTQNNIVTQLFESGFEIHSVMDVNINAIATELQQEIEKEKDARFSLAQTIENDYIPAANLRIESNHAHEYTKSNVGELYDRVEINLGMADYLASLEPKDGDGYYDMALQRADNVFEKAKAKAAEVIEQTIAQKSEEIRQAQAKVAELSALRDRLTAKTPEAIEATETIDDDTMTFTAEVANLTEAAKNYAI